MAIDKLYWEPQKKDLCRLHSLNAYFGEKKLDEMQFKKLCKDYNEYIADNYNEIINSQKYDIFPLYSFVAYVIKELDGKYSYFIPYGKLIEEKHSLEELVHNSKSFFVFNDHHMFVVKFNSGKWHKIDSLNGIVQIELSKLERDKKIGFIIPRDDNDLDYDLNIWRNRIVEWLRKHDILTVIEMKRWLVKNYEQNLLNDLEVPLCNYFAIQKKRGRDIHLYEMILRNFNFDRLNVSIIVDNIPMLLKKNKFLKKIRLDK